MYNHSIDTHIMQLDDCNNASINSLHNQNRMITTPTRVILDNNFRVIELAMQFMRLVIFGKTTSFVAHFSMRRSEVLSPLGKMFKDLRAFADLYAGGYSFHPLLRFFFEQYRVDRISRLDGLALTGLGRADLALYDEFDAFVNKLRRCALAIKLRKQVRNWESKYEKNSVRLKTMQELMFKRYSRVMVIRLDLHHANLRFTPELLAAHERLQFDRRVQDNASYFADKELSPAEEVLPARVPFETVQKDRVRLFANMKGKPSLFRHAIAYAWRMEFTPDAGYHLHLVLFFNGAATQKHDWYAQEIGNYWRDVITRGLGNFHNCNRAWSKDSQGYALGRVDQYDISKRKNLERALEYFCKRTQQVVVMPKKGCNTFGSGFFHRAKNSGLGRPRIKVPIASLKTLRRRYPKSSSSMKSTSYANRAV